MIQLNIKSRTYCCLEITSPTLNAKLNALADNPYGLIPLGHYHISMGSVCEETFNRMGKGVVDLLPISESKFDSLTELLLTTPYPELHEAVPVLRGNADRKSLAVEVNYLILLNLLSLILPDDVVINEPFNNDIKLHISLANITGKPRHSLKDPFGLKPRWVGVDLDGTLAYKDKHYTGEIGYVLPDMKKRILNYIAEGMDVKIFTARVGQPCQKTNRSIEQITTLIQDWLEENGMPRLDVTCKKTRECIRIYDDKAIQVIPNMDITLHENHIEHIHDLESELAIWQNGQS